MLKHNQKRKLGKRTPVGLGHGDKVTKHKKYLHDEEISSDSDVDFDDNRKVEEYSEEEDLETPQEKRLKLAKKYLSEIEAQETIANESKELDRDIVSKRLRHEVLEKAGQLQKKVADSYEPPQSNDLKICRGHKGPVTCLVISSSENFIVSASKDSAIIKWKLNDGTRIKVLPGIKESQENASKGHFAPVQCLALSTDEKFLVSGDLKKIIHVWNSETMSHLHTFHGHRDGITSLIFRKNTHQLFSGSLDRSIKIWNLDEFAYVETLFGHQDSVTAIDSLMRDRAVSSGGRDNTVRLWKVPEESQLIFQGHNASIDCVKLINEQYFVSAADDGSISLWGAHKKKPLQVIKAAHGLRENGEPYWVTALAAFPNTDLIASGSHNGQIHIWKCSEDFKSLKNIFSVPVNGFVNALEFTKSGNHLIAGIGQEHRMGRWWRIKQSKNSVIIITLKQS